LCKNWKWLVFLPLKSQSTYSELSNNHAANLILFEKIFPPTCLHVYLFSGKIPNYTIFRTCTFTYFWGNSKLQDHFEKF
jgi:hypothetical protein